MSKKRTEDPFSKTWDVVIIGGGPAGMMAAGRAGERGLSVLLVEKNPSLGKKLLLTGGGRCNVTNNKPVVREMLTNYKEASKYLFSTFSQHAVDDSVRFFEQHGVPLKEENDGRLFPVSDSSQSIFDALRQQLKQSHVHVLTSSAVAGIRVGRNCGLFKVTLESGEVLKSKSCVVATGGTSRPETGSSGECFAWLASLGHEVNTSKSALVPVALQESWIKGLAGITLDDCKLTILVGGKKQSNHRGRLLFTHFGASGPMVLNASKEISDLLADGTVVLQLDLFPALDNGELRAQLQTILMTESNKMLKNALPALVPTALVAPVLGLAQVDGNTPCHSVRTEERVRLVATLKELPVSVKGMLGANKAVVSSGGVSLGEVNFKTMESRIVPGLHVVGDVLDIERPSGGYSLQLCWSTGYVAGSHICE